MGPLSLEKLLKTFTNKLNSESTTESSEDYVTRMCFLVCSIFLFVVTAQNLVFVAKTQYLLQYVKVKHNVQEIL